jgi:hypothetical protein
LVKYKHEDLQIIDILTKEVKRISGFDTPEAFIFIYEKEVFLSLKEGKISLYHIEGHLLSTIGDKTVYSQEPESFD